MSISETIETPELTTKQKRQANIAKARATLAAKIVAESTYDQPVVDVEKWATIPEPPPNLFPDTPVFRTIWDTIVKSSIKDVDVAQWLANLAPLRAQAEAESALKQRESSLLPAYLQEAPPIIGVALERQDSTLATILHRMDNGLPLSTMEALIGKWINGRRSGSDRTAGAEADAIAEALEREDDQDEEPAENADGNAGEAGESDGGEAISGGLPEQTASGEGSEEREGGAFLGPICAETGPIPEIQSVKKIELPSISDTIPPKSPAKRPKMAPRKGPPPSLKS